MMVDLEAKHLRDHFLDALKAGVAEFEDLVAVQAEQVIVLSEAVGPLVLGLPVAELVALDQAALGQELERIVHGGTAHAHARRPQVGVQRIRIEMAVRFIKGAQHGESLGRLPLTSLAQELGE